MKRFSSLSSALAALAMAQVAHAEPAPMQKDRRKREPSMVDPGPYGASRQRAQWKDETQRRGRQR